MVTYDTQRVFGEFLDIELGESPENSQVARREIASGWQIVTVRQFDADAPSPTSDYVYISRVPSVRNQPSKGIARRIKSMEPATRTNFTNPSARAAKAQKFETAYLIQAIEECRKAGISVSPQLKISRERALETSLFAPSGAYLTWLEMDSADGNV
jgi:hypothetical protein